MTYPLPPDLPDHIKPSIPDAYRVYPAEMPVNGAFIWGLVGWLLFVIALVALGFVVWLA